MKSLLFVSAVLALATMATASPHLEEIFKVNLPEQVADDPKRSVVIDGNLLYISLKKQVAAVNLDSKTLQWTANISNNVDPDTGLPYTVPIFATPSAAYACSHKGLYKLEKSTGKTTWHFPITIHDNFNAPKCNITFSTDGKDVAVLLRNNIYIVDDSNGKRKKEITFDSNGYKLGYSATEGALLFGVHTNQRTFDLTLDVKTLFTDKLLWSKDLGPNTFTYNVFAAVSGFGKAYLLTTNSTNSGDTVMDVLDLNNGNKVISIEAMNGLNSDDYTPQLTSADTLVVVVGFENERKLTIQLSTGYILSQEPYTPPGQGFGSSFKIVASDISKEIKVTQGLELEVGPIGGPYTKAVGFVPSNANFNLQYYGQGIVQIGNLQGWTLWQVASSGASATLLQRDETTPGWAPGGGILYNGETLTITKNAITAYKVVF